MDSKDIVCFISQKKIIWLTEFIQTLKQKPNKFYLYLFMMCCGLRNSTWITILEKLEILC